MLCLICYCLIFTLFGICFSLAKRADSWNADLETTRKALGYGNYSQYGGDLGYHEVSEFMSCTFILTKPTGMPSTNAVLAATTTMRPTTATTEAATTAGRYVNLCPVVNWFLVQRGCKCCTSLSDCPIVFDTLLVIRIKFIRIMRLKIGEI